MPAPPSQLPQSPLLHCRVLFIHPAPHVTLHAPNDDHPVHVRGVPAVIVLASMDNSLFWQHIPTAQLNDCVLAPAHVPHVPLPHVRLWL